MMKIAIIPLRDFLKVFDESIFKKFAKDFKCKKNSEIVTFLKNSSLIFEKENYCRTYLILKADLNSDDKPIIVGFFSLANNKCININNVEADDKEKYFGKLAKYSNKEYESAFLIGQVGRNDCYSKEDLPGEFIFDEIYKIIFSLFEKGGGRVIMLECEPILKDYYQNERGFKYVQNNSNGLCLLLRRTDEIEIIWKYW